jgi:hydrogenase/urease accessory protein HupE
MKFTTTFFNIFILCVICFGTVAVRADVVKPALVEINVDQQRQLNIEVRASIEALLTGINARYKNTQDAPNADEYDFYREMPPEELAVHFEAFQQAFIESVAIKSGEEQIELSISSVDIPARGYTKVPRISVIELVGQLPESADSLSWYYPATFGDNAVRVRQVDTENHQWHWSQWQWLRKDDYSDEFSLTEIVDRQSMAEVVLLYMQIGFEHIIPKGLDHILFVLGLFLLSTQVRPLLWQVTMFTVAHTITLGLAMNNIVDLPANIVEPLIALSIAYIGIENVLSSKLHKSRLLLVFVFGLLHGLGFASVLADFGMPDDDFIEALISFNIGVEFGQLAVILLAFVLLTPWFRDRAGYQRYIVIPGSMMITVVGLFWFFERLEFF